MKVIIFIFVAILAFQMSQAKPLPYTSQAINVEVGPDGDWELDSIREFFLTHNYKPWIDSDLSEIFKLLNLSKTSGKSSEAGKIEPFVEAHSKYLRLVQDSRDLLKLI